MLRVRTTLTGWTGSPGLSTFYFSTTDESQAVAQEVADRVRAFWNGTAAQCWTSNQRANVQTGVDQMDPATGVISNQLIVTAPAEVIGGGGAVSLAAIGTSALLRMGTGVFDDGVRIAGRAYISPLTVTCINSVGQFEAGKKAAMTTAATTFLGIVDLEPILVVWRRPREAGSGETGSLPARPGRIANVTTVSYADKLSFLRSRRD